MGAINKKVIEIIKNHNTNCPFKISKDLGIHIEFENLGSIYGYYTRNYRVKTIHINENLTEGQQTFTCSHELGHAILHPDKNTSFLKKHTLYSTSKIEVEANLFATKLLFSNDYFNGDLTLKDAVEEYGIPEKFLLTYLKNFWLKTERIFPERCNYDN